MRDSMLWCHFILLFDLIRRVDTFNWTATEVDRSKLIQINSISINLLFFWQKNTYRYKPWSLAETSLCTLSSMIDHVFDMYIDSQEKELSTRLSDAFFNLCRSHTKWRSSLPAKDPRLTLGTTLLIQHSSRAANFITYISVLWCISAVVSSWSFGDQWQSMVIGDTTAWPSSDSKLFNN